MNRIGCAGVLAVTLALAGCSSDAGDSAGSAASSSPAASSSGAAETPVTTPSPLVTPAPASHAENYTVVPGDTLSGIAARFGIPIGALMERNGLTMDSVIHPGQVLNVSGMPAPGNGGNPPPPPVNQPGTKTYVVQPGDGLSDVALRFGGDIGEIMRLNGFAVADATIHPGQVLIVPDKPGVGPYFPGNGGNPPPPPVTPPGTKTYVVEPGGSLSDVALRFGGDIGEILRLNGFASVDTVIHPGQVLIVPDKPGVGPYFPGNGGNPPPPISDVNCGQFNIGST
ncbi:LysM peptidoglycan-binding domain-containing protein, partial [Rhodococcus sp. NPDC058514]